MTWEILVIYLLNKKRHHAERHGGVLVELCILEYEGETGRGGSDVEAEAPVGLHVVVVGQELRVSSVAAASVAASTVTTSAGGTAVGRHQPDAGAHHSGAEDGAYDADGLDGITDSLDCLLPLLHIGVVFDVRHVAYLRADIVEHIAKEPHRGAAEHVDAAEDDAEDTPAFARGIFLCVELIIDDKVGGGHGKGEDAGVVSQQVVCKAELGSRGEREGLGQVLCFHFAAKQ